MTAAGVGRWALRASRIALGVALLFTPVFHAPTSAEAIGVDSANVAIDVLALWMIYRGIWPAHRPSPAN